MYKIERNYTSSPEHMALYGGYNDFPPAWKEITTEEFAQKGYALGYYIEYRQMMKPKELCENGRTAVGFLHFHENGQGFAIMTDQWKKTVRYFTFDAIEKLKALYNELPHLTAVCECLAEVRTACDCPKGYQDSGWWLDKVSSRPERGLRDYNRSIKFSRCLTDLEMKTLLMYLKRKCPGWTGITVRNHTMNSEYVFRTTCDSSD